MTYYSISIIEKSTGRVVYSMNCAADTKLWTNWTDPDFTVQIETEDLPF